MEKKALCKAWAAVRREAVMETVDDNGRPARVPVTQVRLAELTGIRQQNLSRYETDIEPSLDQLVRLESAIGVPLGTTLRRAGYVDDAMSVASVIEQDPSLSPRYAAILLDTYRSMQAASAAERAAAPTTRRQRRRAG